MTRLLAISTIALGAVPVPVPANAFTARSVPLTGLRPFPGARPTNSIRAETPYRYRYRARASTSTSALYMSNDGSGAAILTADGNPSNATCATSPISSLENADGMQEMEMQVEVEVEATPPDLQSNGNGNGNEIEIENAQHTELSKSSDNIASYRELIIFASTTIIIWLSEPLLSLVDTTIVGKFAPSAISNIRGLAPETLQLAALAPATMLCDNAFYFTYFLAIATTNQLAVASAQSNNSLQVKTTSHALGIASIMGAIITLTFFLYGDSMLGYILGSGGAIVNGLDMTSHVISSSWDYAKIRGIIAPLTTMGIIAQAVSLATRDTRTPALAVVVASIVNVVGDLVLVAKCRMGLRGAALATAAAGAASSLLLVKEAKKKVQRWRRSAAPKNDDDDQLPFISLPDAKSFLALVKLAGPIVFVILGKMFCYSAMTLTASSFGMMSMATHNIMMRIFFFFCTFGDSFSMAAQSFLPRAMYGEEINGNENDNDNEESQESKRNIGKVNKERSQSLLKRILLLASGMAVTNSFMAKTIMQHGGRFFTNDGVILSMLANPSPIAFMMGSVLLHPLIMTVEGSILATRDLGFLVTAYGFTMATMLSVLKFATTTFTGVWKALFLFQVIRLAIFGSRVFLKTRGREVEPRENSLETASVKLT